MPITFVSALEGEQPKPSAMVFPHPLDPLSPDEITKAAGIAKDAFPGKVLNFRFITLKEPLKRLLTPYLNAEHASHASQELTNLRPPREARVQVISPSNTQRKKPELHELIVDIEKNEVVKTEYLEGKHSYIDAAYMQDVERACMADERVKEEVKKLKLPEGATVVVEPWAYATDGMCDTSERTTMCWFYMRLSDNPDANYYAYPVDLCAEVSEHLKVTKIYRLPSSEDERIHNVDRPYDHRKVQDPSLTEYHPDLRPPPRDTTKPLHVTQPEGPSFKVEGKLLTWEKWRLRVGFNYREGLVLHDVHYDNRSILHRVSLSEMFVPYADPRAPYPRKGAFDLGNDGAGINANNLQLGCDCLGSIHYFSAWHNTSTGEPLKLPNVICCHEQDEGILWKHTNFRTGRGVVARARVLVLQTVVTVSNYEYVFAWRLGQDAGMEFEVRATGILSTVPIEIGDKVPYGTVVAPGVLAPYHQHLFCLRIDPAVDGDQNSLVVEESVAMPMGDDKVHNPFGIGYVTEKKIVEVEAALDLDFTKNRVFKIVNEGKVNEVTGTPVGLKLVPCYSQLLLAHPSSYHARRSEFGAHAVWVTRHDDEEIFPAGRHTMQSTGGGGIASGIAARQQQKGGHEETSTLVRGEDIVVWHTFGSTHNPRIEDWPVMPMEKMVVGLKPVNMFKGNPGLDVKPAMGADGCSVLVEGGPANLATRA